MAAHTRCIPRIFNTLASVSTHLRTGRSYSCAQFLADKRRVRLISNGTVSFHSAPILLKRRKTAEERKSRRIIEYSPKPKGEVVEVWPNVTVKELAQILDRDVYYVQELFLNEVRGAKTVISDLRMLQEAIKRAGKRMRVVAKPRDVKVIETQDVYCRPPAPKSALEPRPPIVTVMGHVDHGKTTLLDALRHTNVVKQEFGGITQHIGAFSVSLKSGAKITFLDTPGHAAFSAMRERGANITDIVVLVVAADDGVMEQTIESVRMARQANVPIIVAVNKIDSPKADVERTLNMLVGIGIQVESLGGDVQAIPISALQQKNLDNLTEALVVQAEILDIGADPTGPVEAVVVESKVDQHRGRLCTLIVQRGTLKKGAFLVADTVMAKVRLLRDAQGNVLDEVKPGYPAEVEGWKDLVPAGEIVLEVESEKIAKYVLKVREERKMLHRQNEDAAVIQTKTEQHKQEYTEKLKQKRLLGRFRTRQEGPRKPEIEKDDGSPKLNLIVKGDVDGTLEAILDTLTTYNSSECQMNLVHYAVGAITETDIELAKTFNGIIYAFNVTCSESMKALAAESGVTIKDHNVIYKLVDDIKSEINSRLPQKEVEEVLGEATVLKLFEINDGRRKVPVAGCRCTKGLLKKSSVFRLIRNDDILHEGPLIAMRHLKSEVDTIKKDIECGLQLANKEVVFQPGDTLICLEKKMVPQTTSWDPGF